MFSSRPFIFRGSTWTIAALAAATVITSMAAAVSASPELLADYKATNYNPVTGVWSDSSGNGDNATVSTGVTAPTLISNATPNGSSAVSFSGNNSYLDITTGLADGSGYTVLAFAEPTGIASGPAWAVVGGGPGAMEYRFQQQSGTGNIQVLLKTDTLAYGTSNTGVSGTAFSMVGVATDNTGNATFYLNGKADGTTTGTNAFSAPVDLLGATDSGAGATPAEFFLGDIAEIQIYSGVLSGAQIQAVNQSFINDYVNPVPEPAALAVMVAGTSGLLLLKRRRS